MTFEHLQYGDVFYIDGAPFQCYKKTGRLVTALVLTEDLQHVPDTADATGLKTTLFCDTRVNGNNATPQQCEDYLNHLRTLNR